MGIVKGKALVTESVRHNGKQQMIIISVASVAPVPLGRRGCVRKSLLTAEDPKTRGQKVREMQCVHSIHYRPEGELLRNPPSSLEKPLAIPSR